MYLYWLLNSSNEMMHCWLAHAKTVHHLQQETPSFAWHVAAFSPDWNPVYYRLLGTDLGACCVQGVVCNTSYLKQYLTGMWACMSQNHGHVDRWGEVIMCMCEGESFECMPKPVIFRAVTRNSCLFSESSRKTCALHYFCHNHIKVNKVGRVEYAYCAW